MWTCFIEGMILHGNILPLNFFCSLEVKVTNVVRGQVRFLYKIMAQVDSPVPVRVHVCM